MKDMKILLTKMPLFALIGIASITLLGCEKPAESNEVSIDSTKTASVESSPATTKPEVTASAKETSADTKNNRKPGKPIPVDLSNPEQMDKLNALLPTGKKSADLSSLNAKDLTAQPGTPGLLTQVVTATPESLDLGAFSTSETGTGSVTLTNTSDTAVTIERAKASCGCTTSDFKQDTVLLPGESTDISVTMNGKGRARKLSKTVTFSITGYPPLRVPVVAETIEYVTIDQNPIAIQTGEKFGTIILTSIDDQPFTVTSILPAIAELPTEAATSQELQLNWEDFWDVVQTTKITIRLDHPLCSEITTNIRLSAEQRQRLNEIIKLRREGGVLPTKDPTRPLNGDQLTQYIKAGKGMQVIKYIEDGLGSYDAVNRGGVTLLSSAAEAGYPDTVIALIALGAQVERVDRVNRTPLMYAARSKNPETIQVLIDEGADIQSRDRLGNTPLSWASGFGIASGVQVLIDAGADANTVDTVLGYTPLIWAAGFGDTDSVAILVEAGADVSVNDIAEGRTPLMHAVRTGKIEAVALLINAGAKVNGIDNKKSTALHIGAGSNNVTLDKIELLVASGADVNAKNSSGETALDLAKLRTDDNGSMIVEYLSNLISTE